jgi:hypothetical protein
MIGLFLGRKAMRSFLILLGVMLAFSTGTDATAGPADLNAESLPSEQQQSSMLREYGHAVCLPEISP